MDRVEVLCLHGTALYREPFVAVSHVSFFFPRGLFVKVFFKCKAIKKKFHCRYYRA